MCPFRGLAAQASISSGFPRWKIIPFMLELPPRTFPPHGRLSSDLNEAPALFRTSSRKTRPDRKRETSRHVNEQIPEIIGPARFRRRTLVAGSSLNRFASAQPADPPPKIMKSYISTTFAACRPSTVCIHAPLVTLQRILAEVDNRDAHI